jgi:hypothetical protein
MFASPQTVTINTVDQTLDRVVSKETSSVYRDSDGEFEMTLSHQESKTRTRHLARLDQTVVAADPLTSVNAYQKAGVYVVIDEPLFGFSDDELYDLVAGLTAFLTEANVLALLSNRH